MLKTSYEGFFLLDATDVDNTIDCYSFFLSRDDWMITLVENVSRQICDYILYMYSLANEPEKVTMQATNGRSRKGVVAPLVCINLGNTG